MACASTWHRALFHLALAASISGVFGGLNCTTNPSYLDKGAFEKFFDQCFIDNTAKNIPSSIAQKLQDWFNEGTYPVYVLVSLLVLLFCVIKEVRGNSEMARYNFIRLQGLLLLMRIGLSLSMTPWLWAAIQQQRPCVCEADRGGPVALFRWWGMPSGICFTSTLIATHFMEALSVPLGIAWLLLMWGSSIALGQYSIGQSLVGILLGVVLHFYSTRTPVFMRIVDFVATLVAGFVSIGLAMRAYPHEDFSFSINFLTGLIWQVYAFTLLYVAFEWDFMRKALRKSVHTLHDVDFLYFRPLTSRTPEPDDAPTFPAEARWTVFLTVALFIVLCGLQILSPYLNDLTVYFPFPT